jgi:hypothetical protein
VYEVQYIPGKGVRCRGKKGSFIKCPRTLSREYTGEIGEINMAKTVGKTVGKTGKLGRTGKLGASQNMGRVSSKVVTKKFIKGKGLRCWDRKGKFTSCFSGTGKTVGTGRTGGALLGKTSKKRKSTTKKRVRIKGKGMRCRRPDGRFVKC